MALVPASSILALLDASTVLFLRLLVHGVLQQSQVIVLETKSILVHPVHLVVVTRLGKELRRSRSRSKGDQNPDHRAKAKGDNQCRPGKSVTTNKYGSHINC